MIDLASLTTNPDALALAGVFAGGALVFGAPYAWKGLVAAWTWAKGKSVSVEVALKSDLTALEGRVTSLEISAGLGKAAIPAVPVAVVGRPAPAAPTPGLASPTLLGGGP